MGDAAVNSDTIQFPCSACGARLQFDPAAAELLCQHCGFSEPIPQSEAEVVERDFHSYTPDSDDWEMEMRQWHCEKCGADTITERTVTSFSCPFCASNLVSATDELIDKHTPESLLPFRITEAEALNRFREWIQSLWFRPNALKTQARGGKIRGTYVPFWTFDALTHSFWTAQSGTYYYVKNSKGERERKIRWRTVNGTHNEFFDDELVSGSTVLDDSLWRRIEPFPTDELVGFREEYLAGHMALAYETDMLECWPTAKEQIDHRIRAACRRSIPGDTHRGLAVTTSYLNRTYKLCLLPIWIAAYRYRGESYTYLVNGINGNIAGKAPWSLVKILSAVSVLSGLIYGLYRYLL
jgi:hypothetical protein